MSSHKLSNALALIVVLALGASAINPFDRTTWWLEVAPVFLALPYLAASRRHFALTPMLYWIIAIHALILIAGGAWSYARVPLGFWIEHGFNLSRNPYDKIGHFFQGVTPALLTREILLRRGYLRTGKMVAFLAICVATAFSACYELVEWGAAVSLGQGADEFLGTLGDPWDTQSDMFMALIGACCAMTFLRRTQDRQMQALSGSTQ